jgi:chemotaxis protein histidine kinase CheA
VQRRLEELGGSLLCESPLENGRGTRFQLSIPLDNRAPETKVLE